MSMEVSIIPMLFDLAVLARVLMEDHKRMTVMERGVRGMLTEEEAADMRLEVEALRRSGCDIRIRPSESADDASVLIHTDKGYDIGIRRNEKGAYDVVAHWSAKPGKIEIQNVRADIESRIKQKYAYEKVRRELAKKGFMISNEEVQPDNTIRLVARKW